MNASGSTTIRIPTAVSASARDDPEPAPLGDRRDHLPGATQRRRDVDRAQQRGRGRREHRAAGGEHVEPVAQVAEIGVPDRLRGIAGAGVVDPSEEHGADHPERDRRDHARDDDRDPEGRAGSGAGRASARARSRRAPGRARAGSAARPPRSCPAWASSVNQVGGSIGVDLDVDAPRDLLRELRGERLQRPAHDHADVGERQRRGVLVALEEGAVDVADRGAEAGPGTPRRRRSPRPRSRSPAGSRPGRRAP